MNTKTKSAVHAALLLIGLIAIVGGFALALLFTGCAGFQKFQTNPNVQKAEQIGLAIGLQFAEQELSGGKINAAWAIPTALNATSTVLADNPNTAVAAGVLKTAAVVYTGDPQFKTAGRDLAQAFIALTPANATAAQKKAIVTALSTGVSNGVQAASDATAVVPNAGTP